MHRKPLLACALVVLPILLFSGCSKTAALTLYTDADKDAVVALTKPFTQKTGVRVDVKAFSDVHELADSVAVYADGKYTLATPDNAQKRADVVFSTEMDMGEVLNERSALTQYTPAAASGIPSGAKSDGLWYGVGGRAWVLAWNTDAVKQPPKSLFDLADGAYAGKAAMINPNYILYYSCGAEAAAGGGRAVQLYQTLLNGGARWCGKPEETAQLVAEGQASVGLTTLEMAEAQKKKGLPIAWALPDQGSGQIGAYVRLNVVCLPAGGAQLDEAKLLEDYLLDPSTEALCVKLGLADVTLRPCGSDAPVALPLNTNLSAAQNAMQSQMGALLTYFTTANPNYKGE